MRQAIFSLFFLLSLSDVYAKGVASFFIQMPDNFIPQLEEAWRKDLVDLYESGKPATLDNTMGGRSTLEKMTKDYLLLKYTDRSTLEIKLLPLINDTYVACVITTVMAPIADSRVDFFTMEWKSLSSADLFTPVLPDWFIKDGININTEGFLEAISYLDIDLIQYQLNSENLTITATYKTPEYLFIENRAKVKRYLKDSSKIFHWKSGRFID